MHAVIEAASPDAVSIIDLGAEEGTFVNGERVAKATLRTGDEIEIGPFSIQVVEIRGAPQTTAERFRPEPRSPGKPCPRCRAAIREVDVSGLYRDAAMRVSRCDACALTFLDVAELATRIGRPVLRLSGSAFDRGHVPTRSGCPACLATMNEVTLSWGGTWVVVEECPRCGLLALDEGEVDAMASLAGQGSVEGGEAWERAGSGAAALLEKIGTGTQ
jgi:Zn-finger nucleic acid-binding protein